MQAQSTWNNPKFQDAVGAAAKPILQALCDHASAPEKRICADVEFRITWDSVEIGLSPKSVTGPRRVVKISALMVRQLLMTNQAMVIEHYLKRQGFMKEYIQYVSKRLSQDPGTQWPTEFANLTPDQKAILDGPAAREAERSMFEGGMAFVMAHELAHQVLNHGSSGSDCAIRAEERAADEKAVRYMLTIGQLPVSAVPVLLFSYYTGGQTLEAGGRTHPSDAQRIRAFEQATIDRLSDFDTLIRQRGQNPETVRAELTNGVRKLDAEIASLPADHCGPGQ